MIKKTTKEIGSELEQLVVAHLQEIDPSVRVTRASGARGEKADIKNSLHQKMECKVRNTENCIIQRKWWLKLNRELNIYNLDTPVLVLQNKHKETFVVLDIKDYVRLLKKATLTKEK
jgi:hypothetical protein